MSNISYSLIDDDHIDDQETINVGNLIIDLESDLEKGSGQASNAQPTTSNSPPTSSSPLGSESNNNARIMTAGSSTRDCGTSTSIGTITEPDCLGPCEPGTSVTLEGIVWQETEGGVLVVNVTWRGKTYVGALLDCTKHDWAPPRLCDSPASDVDSKAHRGVRLKRIFTRSGLDEKNLLQTTGKLRNGKGRRILPPNDGYCVQMNVDTAPTATTKSEPISTNTKETDNKAGPNSPVLIGCSEPNCSKKYRNMNGLMYHQAHAHNSDNDSSNAQDEACSLLNKDKERDSFNQESTPSTSGSTSTAPMQEPRSSTKSLEAERHTPPSGPPRNPSYQGRSPVINSSISNNNTSISNSNNSTSNNNSSSNNNNNNNTINNSMNNTSNNNTNYPPPKSTSSSSKQQSNPPPEEGMKPSGTSTGPPPAPHQTNCYFNSAYLANAYGTSPYGIAPFIPRPPLPIYNQFTSPTFPPRFMNSMRVPPPPEPPAHLASPSDQDVRLRCCPQLQRQQAARRG